MRTMVAAQRLSISPIVEDSCMRKQQFRLSEPHKYHLTARWRDRILHKRMMKPDRRKNLGPARWPPAPRRAPRETRLTRDESRQQEQPPMPQQRAAKGTVPLSLELASQSDTTRGHLN